jgi:hypothetical protein
MSEITRQMEALRSHLEEVRKALGADAPGFESQLAQLGKEMIDGNGTPADHDQELAALLEQFPKARDLMRQAEPALFHGSMPIASNAQPGAAGTGTQNTAPTNRAGSGAGPGSDATVKPPPAAPKEPPQKTVTPAPSAVVQAAPQGSVYVLANQWTPQVYLQVFKEIVTALIGLMLIAATLLAAYWTFNMAGDKTKISDGKDILMLLMGLAGVVTGYYFGRVPADARAAQSEVQANAATANAEQVAAKSQEILEQTDKVLSTGVTRGGADTNGPEVEKIRRLRSELHAILGHRSH